MEKEVVVVRTHYGNTDTLLLMDRPNDQKGVNPAKVYLDKLHGEGRRGIETMLNLIAKILSDGRLNCFEINWPALRYEQAMDIRDFLITVRFEKETDKGKEEWDYKPATINLALSALRGVLTTSWKMGLMTTDDYLKAKSIESVKSSTELAGRDISPDEIEALMKVCEDDKSIAGARESAIIAILTMCGLHRNELAIMMLEDYDRENDKLIVHGKGAKDRVEFITGNAKLVLEDWLAIRGNEPGCVFYPIDKAGKIKLRIGITVEGVYWIINPHRIEAGLDRFMTHDFQRSFISNLLDTDTDIVTVSRLAGYSDPRTTMRYDRRGDKTRKNALEKLNVPYTRRPLARSEEDNNGENGDCH